MKKLVLSALILVLIFALTGTATVTRVMTLGEANNIVKDNANILLYPSTLNFYRDAVCAEVDATGLYLFAAHYNFGDDKGVVGLYFDKTGLPLIAGYQPDPAPGDPTDPLIVPNGMIDNRIGLFYGRPFGDTYFGFALSLYSDSWVSEVSGEDTEEKNMALGVQVGVTALEEKLDVAGGFLYGPNWTYVNMAGDDVTEPESNMAFMLAGRYWHEFNDEVYFVPHLGFDYGTFGVKEALVLPTGKATVMSFDLGWGVNISPADDVLLLFDLGFMYSSEKAENGVDDTVTDMNLPYFKAGFEGNVTDWWDVRFGAIKRWMSESDDDAYKAGWAETDTYVGSAVHFGNLDIDVYLNPALALNGPYFVSGTPTQLAYQASLVYNIP